MPIHERYAITRKNLSKAIWLATLLATLLAVPRSARAQDYDVHLAIDGAVIGIAAAGTLALMLVPVDTSKRWNGELFGSLDQGVHRNFSVSAAKLSDGLIAATIVTPVLVQLDRGLDQAAWRRAVVYTEAIGVNLFANALSKYLIQRPRPYSYNQDSRVIDYARTAGSDSHLSFFSGHSSTAFTAAVAGSYLFAASATDTNAKAAMWFFELALASATANLRVRAGKHFYSDIAVGAVAGCLVGWLVPALHATSSDGSSYRPSGREWIAMGSGLIAGSLVSQLLPMANDIIMPLDPAEVALVPMVLGGHSDSDSGAGLALTGLLW